MDFCERALRSLSLALAICAPTCALIVGSASAVVAQPAPPAVTVAPAALQDVTPQASFVGRVQATDTVNVVARVSGFIEKRAFTEGQQVKTGDLLFVIELDTYQAAVDQAQAALDKAQANARNADLTLQRSQQLVRTNAVPQSTVDQDLANQQSARADVESAQAALRQAQINLDYTQIKAPIDGRIGMALVSVGNFVSPTSGTLATIVSQDPIYVLFPVSASQVLEYKQQIAKNPTAFGNLLVHLRLPNGLDYTHVGSIDFLDIQVNQGTNTISVRAQFPNPDGFLVAGQIVDVSVEAGQAQQALVIPQAALQLDQTGPYVLVVDASNKVVQQRVKLGSVQGSNVVAEQGLKQGDRVIVQGIQRVRPGETVTPSEAAGALP